MWVSCGYGGEMKKRYGGTGFRKAERRRRRREKWCVAWCDIMAPSCQSGARVAEKAETTLILMPWAHNFDVLVSHVSRRGCCGSSTRRDRDPGTESTSTRHEYKYLGLPPSTLGYLGLEHYNRKPPPEQTTFPRLRPHIYSFQLSSVPYTTRTRDQTSISYNTS